MSPSLTAVGHQLPSPRTSRIAGGSRPVVAVSQTLAMDLEQLSTKQLKPLATRIPGACMIFC